MAAPCFRSWGSVSARTGAAGAMVAAVLLAAGCQRPDTGGPAAGAVTVPATPPAAVTAAASAPGTAGSPPLVTTEAAPAAAAPAASAAAAAGGADLLAARSLVMPVAGIAPATLVDMFDDARTGHRHEAIDILAPRGTPVHAVDDGTLVKLFTSKPGGLTIYQFDPEGRLAYYYAHLDRYAEGIKEGTTLRRGDLIGYVGTSGNAGATPHLHFAVFRLGPERQWWKGDPVNPYPALRRARPAG